MNKKALSVITAAGLGWWGCGHAELLGCLIEPDRVADVGSQSMGVIEKLLVERGDAVSAGQVVARLSAQVERASASVAEVKARAEAEALQAQAASELARRKLERTRDLVKRDFVSDQALDQAEAEARVAEQRVEQAREAQRVARKEFSLSNAQLSQREVRSPFAGLVVERYRTEGERIEREPVVRVARIDPLRIEAIVPAVQFGAIAAGQMATVKTDLPDYAVLSAKVTLVDRVIDPASNSFRVRLSLPNPGNRIPSGVRCRIAFNAAEPAGNGAAPTNAAPPTAAAGQVAPARWQPAPDVRPAAQPARAPVVAVAVAAARPAAQPATEAPAQPRFVSSTLKVAMAQLAKTTPGGRWSERLPAVVPVPATRMAMNKKQMRAATTLALSVQLPSFPLPAGDAAKAATTVVAQARTDAPASAQRPAPAPVSGLHLASVR